MKPAFLALLFASALLAQQANTVIQPDISFDFTLTSTGTVQYPNSTSSLGIKYWRFNYQTSGGFSGISIELDGAPDSSGAPGSWATMPGTVTFGANPQTSTTGGNTGITVNATNINPWVRINVTSLTGSGTITGRVMGYRVNPDGAGAAGCPNPCPIIGNQPANQTTAWTSATTVNTTNSISVSGYGNVAVTYEQSGTITGGVITFEVSADGTVWVPIQMVSVGNQGGNFTYPLQNGNNAWQMYVGGLTNFRVRLSTVISGGGTATIIIAPTPLATEFPTTPGGFCTQSAVITLTTSGLTQIIAASGNQVIHICNISIAFASGVNVQLETGTGTNCASSTTALTGTYQSILTLALDFVNGTLNTPAGVALCVNLGASVTGGGVIEYIQY